jgi:hypothetical protein
MKKILIIFIWILLYDEGLAQSCLPEGIVFTAQSQIDNFKANYPGCTQIEGDVLISGDNITNFYGLNELALIEGDLIIRDNGILSGMYGLDALHNVYGSISIKNNSALRSLDNLSSLWSISGSLRISNNESLVNLQGPGNLHAIGGDLFIDSNLVLFNINDLYSLSAIGNGNIFIRSNAALTSLNGLNNIEPGSISELHLYDNPLLSDCDVASICGFLSEPGGIIEIHDNHNGCNDDEEITTDCSDNCFPDVMHISDQDQIDSIQILYPDCREIMAMIFIEGNYDEDINNLNGFSNVKSIGGSLVIGHCPGLKSLHGLDNLESIGGSLYLDSNDSLENLTNLIKLERLWGGLQLDNVSRITSLSGLENLNYIGYFILLEFNGSLTDLSALENITSIGTFLDIWANPSLTSLTGLDNIESNSISSLYIHDNPLLSECEINNICHYLSMPWKPAFIENNATGCNNADEILDKCDVVIHENDQTGNQVSIFPNPATTSINMDISSPGIELKLYNLTGQLLIHKRIEQSISTTDISNLPTGIYFVKLTGNTWATTVKLVKY